jgi:hypothetical protein
MSIQTKSGDGNTQWFNFTLTVYSTLYTIYYSFASLIHSRSVFCEITVVLNIRVSGQDVGFGLVKTMASPGNQGSAKDSLFSIWSVPEVIQSQQNVTACPLTGHSSEGGLQSGYDERRNRKRMNVIHSPPEPIVRV